MIAAEEEPLPAGWGMTLDPSTGKPYFWHKKTQKTVSNEHAEEEEGLGGGAGRYSEGQGVLLFMGGTTSWWSCKSGCGAAWGGALRDIGDL